MKKLLLSLSTLLLLNGIANNPNALKKTETKHLPSPLIAGEALNFDGVDDYIVASPYTSFTEYTIEAWVKLNNLNDQNIIAATDNNGPTVSLSHNLRLIGGKFEHYTWDGSQRIVTSPIVIAAGTWYHVAITAKNSGKISIAVNNAVTTSTFSIGNLWNGLNKFRFGGNAMNMGHFNGEMDEVRVWNRQMCLDEITSNMNGEIAGASTNLLGNYHFNQGDAGSTNTSVTTLTDASGFGKNGTLTNFTLTGTTSNWINPGAVTSGNNVSAYIKPNITVTTPTLACSGIQHTITASGATTYSWSNGAPTPSIYVTNTVSSPTAYTYTVTGYSNNGCPTNPNIFTYTVYPNPAIIVSNGYTCTGTNYTINPTGASNYSYSTGSNIITPTANTSFTVSGITMYGCTNSSTAIVFVQNCGQSGSSLSFDGVNDVVNTNVAYNNIGTNWTFECWAKGASTPATNKGHSGPMYGANRSIVWHHANATFMAGASVQDANLNYFAASYGTLLPETWYHLAATYDGNVLKAYKNGVLTNSITTTGGISSATGNLMFGRHPSITQFWDGAMDEARIWTTTRTCFEINQYMNSELTGNEAGLYAYYNFNEGTPMGSNTSITSILDNTSNALNASISNFALTGNSSNFFLGAPFDAAYSCGVTTINETMAMEKEFNVYPNPTNSILHIAVKKEIKLSIINIIGEELFTETVNDKISIDVSKLSSGVYFVKNTQNGKTLKFIKE